MTREEALKKFEALKSRKREATTWMVEQAKEEYRTRTGQEPKFVEIW